MSVTDPRTDAQLVAAADDGDARAFDALYVRHRGWVLRVATRFTNDHAEALDVLQETFLYLLGRFPGFTLTARLTTYLYPVIRNIALTRHRRAARVTPASPASLDALPDARHGTSAALSGDLVEILAALPDGQREVLLMRFVDQMTPDEIARALQIPSGTAKSRLHAAIQRLRDDPRTRRYFSE